LRPDYRRGLAAFLIGSAILLLFVYRDFCM
jgi:hypothetical protein